MAHTQLLVKAGTKSYHNMLRRGRAATSPAQPAVCSQHDSEPGLQQLRVSQGRLVVVESLESGHTLGKCSA